MTPRPVPTLVPHGRWSRRLSACLALTMTVSLLTPLSAGVAAEAEEADHMSVGIASLAARLDELALDPLLGTRLPMTLQSPASLLGFPTLFTDSLGSVNGAGPTTAVELEAALDALDLTDATGTTVTVDGTSGLWTVAIDVDHSATATIPLLYLEPTDESDPEATPGVSLTAGQATDVAATVDGTLTLYLDPSVTQADSPTTIDLDRAISLDPASSLTFGLSTGSAASTVTATSTFGLTAVDVAGTAGLDLAVDVGFVDPDGVSGITREEWQTVLLADLTVVVPGTTADPDLDISLSLTSDLIDGSDHGTLAYSGDVASWEALDGTLEPRVAPTLTLGTALAPFANVSVEDALASLAQYATAVQALQGSIDVPLPFVTARLGGIYSPAAKVMQVVERQAAAAVVCGKVPTSPPTGADLAGDTWYCQGFANEDPTAVTWSLEGSNYEFVGTNHSGASAVATLGVSPTSQVVIKATGTEDGTTPPDLSVDFTITDDEGDALVLTADRRFRTAAQLATALDAVLDTASVDYDPDTASLVWDLSLSEDPDAVSAAFDIGDQLRTLTHLTGLASAGTPVSADLGAVTLDAGFGLLMQDTLPDDDEGDARPRGDRYFFVDNGSEPELAVASAAGSLTVDEDLTGRIGFLGVEATVDSADFLIGANTANDSPAMGADVTATTGLDPDGTGDAGTITGAIRFRDLLTDPSGAITPAFNVKGHLPLDVAAAGALDLGIDATDDTSVDVTWADYPTTGASITMGTQYTDLLYPLDIAPTLDGTYLGADDGTQVSATHLDFTTAFGEPAAVGDVVPRVLTNLTSGASCVGIEVIDATTIACAEADATTSGLQGANRTLEGTGTETTPATPDNRWLTGDRWLVEGNPDALRDVLLDALYDLADRLASSTNADFTADLPLIGLSPAELTPQLPGIVTAINELRVLPDDPGASGETADGVPEAHTGPAAPEDLQALLVALEAALTGVAEVTASGVAPTVDLSELTNPGTTGDATGGTGTHLELNVGVPVADLSVEAPIRIDLGDDTSLNEAAGLDLRRDGADVSTTLPVTYSSTVQLDVAVPVDPTIPIRHVLAMDTAGISSMDVAAGSADVSFDASLGALTLVAGTGAELTGTHVVPTGTHTGDTIVASGTHVAATGTATGATTANTVGGPTGELQVGDTVTRTGDPALTCDVTAVDANSFTCDLSEDWASGAEWTATTMATLVPDAAPTVDVTGMVLRRGTDECTLGSNDVADCALTGWTDGAAWDLHQGLELEDSARTTDDGFDTLVEVTPPAVRTTITTRRMGTGDATGSVLSTCQTDGTVTLGTTTLPCDGLQTSGGDDDTWETGDPYELLVGDPSTTLYDPSTPFHDMELVGATVINTTGGGTESCVVTSATADTLVCSAGLSGGDTWDAGDTYLVQGVGEARMRLDDYTLNASMAAIPDYVDGMAGSRTGMDVTCGSRTDHACAQLSLMVPGQEGERGRYLGVLRWQSDIDGAIGSTDLPTLSRQAKEALAGEEPIQFSLLSMAFQALRAAVAEALEGTLINEPLPLVGVDVSAGARLLEAIDLAEAEVAAAAPAALTTTTDLVEMETLLTGWITTALTDVTDIGGGTLLELLAPTGADPVDVTFWCGEGTECDPTVDGEAHTLADVTDATVDFAVGNYLKAGETVPGTNCANCTGDTVDLGFDIGLDGLPIDTEATLEAKVGWSMPISLGLSRSVGPYLDVSDDEFELDALVQLPDGASGDCPALPAAADGFSATRCLQANIGLFQGVMWDGEDPTDGADPAPHPDDANSDRTQLRLETKLELDQEAQAGRISAASVLGGELPTMAFTLDADGNVDLYFRTGVDLTEVSSSLPGAEGLPSVQGAMHVSYAVSTGVMLGIEAEGTGYSGDILFDRLILDAGSFFTNFVSPIAQEIQTYTKPIKPVIDILYTPIPVISDVSKMTGNGEVRPIDVLRVASGSDLTMLDRVVEIILFADQVVGYAAQGFIPLGEDDGDDTLDVPNLPGVPADAGKFAVSPKGSRKGDCGGKNADGSLKSKNCETTYKKGGTTGTTKVKQLSSCGTTGTAPCTGKEMTRTVSTRINKPKVIPGGLTFPFMNDASQVFGMVMGESDATLVRFDAGTLVASAGLSVSFGPFMAGPVPIDISVGATFSLSGRLVMGYDTRGITNMLKQDPGDFNPAALLDGIFIDDLDLNGVDVPEITVAVTATLAASVSVKIFKVGLEGGVTLTIEFNLNDPDADGKMRIDEILTLAAADPICLFDVRGTLGFFLGFFVEIDLFVKTVRWSKTLFRVGPFELFEISCTPEPPALATENVDDPGTSDTDTDGDLRLNIGEPGVGYVEHRNYAEDRPKERYLVRQLTAEGDGPGGGTRVSIEGFGLYQEFTVAADGHIWGLAGSDNDSLRFEAGTTGVDGPDADDEPDVIPFTLPVHVDGGAGNDKISTGAGADRVLGGTGNDTLQTGAGNDVAIGGTGIDNIAGGAGNDALDGGGDDDIVSGEQGKDVVAGGAGNDDLGGGPGLDTDTFDALLPSGRVTESERAALTDGADVLWGGDGDDRLRGHFGNDVIFGDELLGFGTSTPANVEALATAFGGGLAGLTASPGEGTGDACTAAGAAGGGADTLEGEAGDDKQFAGGGADQVTGGSGDDLACGNDGRDLVDGDTASGASGDDEVDGGSGNDQVLGRGGHDLLRGGAGNDLLEAGIGNDVLLGGAGQDTLSAGVGNDVAMGDGGSVTATVDATFGGGAAALAAGGIVPDGEAGPAGDAPVAPAACTDRVAIRSGLVDIDGDGDGDVDDNGFFAGHVVKAGRVDIDGDGNVADDADDAGVIGDVGVVLGKLQTTDVILQGAASGATSTDADCILGDQGNDILFGNAGDDVVQGGVGGDAIGGNAGSDWLRGAQDDDTIHGGAGPDTIFGDSGDDVLRGGAADLSDATAIDGDDIIDGGPNADDIAGNAGGDTLRGGAGTDAIVGGSPEAGQADGGDTIDGGAADDMIAGDNAVVVRDESGIAVGFTLLDIPFAGGSAADVGGGDTVDGGAGDDLIQGQQGTDTLRGGRHDDVISGGSGADHIVGDVGNDELVGGSSTHLVDTAGTAVVTDLPGVSDADGDLIEGGNGQDLIAGDNARINASGTITLFDVPLVAEAAVPASVAGGDTISGGDDVDVIRGQSGADTISGGGDEDDIEGNAGSDQVWGEQDADVIIGGSRILGVHDSGDRLAGGGGADLVLGDNADVTGSGAPVERAVVLHDVPGIDGSGAAEPGGDTAGDDLIWGDDDTGDTGAAAADRIYGQADDDTIHGQDGDDDLQGNAGDDTIYGEDGQDRVVGGSATDQSGTGGADQQFSDVADGDDDLAGGGGRDWIAGDNAVISPSGAFALADIPLLTSTSPATGVAGADLIHGDDALDGDDLSSDAGDLDVIRGQSDGDTIHGQTDDDDIEGNAGADDIYGDDGDDDIVGGSRLAEVDDREVGDRGDYIAGGTGTDWIAGDNALLVRHADDSRTIVLLDVPVAGAATQPFPEAAGGDEILGDIDGNDLSASGTTAAADVIYGQSGDDAIDGQQGDDTIDGNAGADTILGDSGDDALVGGSSADDGVDEVDADVPTGGPGQARRLLAGVADGADDISGGPGVDVVLGDNGVVADHGVPATWRLHDVDVAGAAGHAHVDVAGPDVLAGNGDTDVVIGQAGADRLSGGDADDSLHGGPGADIGQGDGGADDLVGGSSHHWTATGLVELRTVLDGDDLLFGNAPEGACAAGLPGDASDCGEANTDPGGSDLGDTIIGDNGHVTRDEGDDARRPAPTRDVNTGDPVRGVLLYDVDIAGGLTHPGDSSGSDTAFGAAGRDRIFGQADGDVLYGQQGDDEVEGNGGSDRIVGSDGSDDLIGGSSSDEAGTVQAGPFPESGTNVADGDDEIDAGTDDDVALGDNGIILRPVAGEWEHHLAPYGHVKRSTVEVAFAFEVDGAFGADTIDAGSGHDDARGQLGSDTIHGREGDDTLIGDLGHLLEYVVVTEDDGRTGSETLPADALNEPVYRTGSLYREVELFETQADRDPQMSTSLGTGDDLITGGAGNDAIHAGSGNDTVHGHGDIADDEVPGAGPDVAEVEALDAACATDASYLACDEDDVFAGHGNDAVWGGPGHDRLFGGHNADSLDVIRAEPGSNGLFGNPDVDYVGIDLIFGGWGQDAMQADQSFNGPDPGDRLIDSAGAYNAFFVCDGGYGDFTAMRRLDPARIAFLENVAIAAGAYQAATSGESGWWALANIYHQDVRHNTNPVHPENPGNFVCNTTEEPEPEPTGTTAAFSFACTDLACTFTDESSSDATTVTLWEWSWDFGGEATSTDQHPAHTFAADGTYDVTLTATADGVADTIVQQVQVQVGAVEPATIELEATGSKVKGDHVADLTWSGADEVTVWRDGVEQAPASGGSYRDPIGGRESATYLYKVCDAADPDRCSAELTVSF